MTTEINISALHKAYTKGKNVINPLDLTIKAGELFFLLGPSGCGKSTLLRILAGLLDSDGGKISFNGEDITKLPPEKRQTAMVFQNYALWPHMSVYDNVAFGLKAAKLPKDVVKQKSMEALELVQMADMAERKIPSLSGGQQQRVAVARAIAVEPAVLLLDEPLSNLDARLRDSMRSEIRRVVKARNLTAVYVTHDRKEALATADRLAVMNGGVLQQVGTPRELYLNPANIFVAEFLGEVNSVSARSISTEEVDTQLGILKVSNSSNLTTESKLIFRPEQLELATPETKDNLFEAEIIEELYAGEYSSYTILCNGVKLKYTRLAPPENLVGQRVKFTISPEFLRIVEG